MAPGTADCMAVLRAMTNLSLDASKKILEQIDEYRTSAISIDLPIQSESVKRGSASDI